MKRDQWYMRYKRLHVVTSIRRQTLRNNPICPLVGGGFLGVPCLYEAVLIQAGGVSTLNANIGENLVNQI